MKKAIETLQPHLQIAVHQYLTNLTDIAYDAQKHETRAERKASIFATRVRNLIETAHPAFDLEEFSLLNLRNAGLDEPDNLPGLIIDSLIAPASIRDESRRPLFSSLLSKRKSRRDSLTALIGDNDSNFFLEDPIEAHPPRAKESKKDFELNKENDKSTLDFDTSAKNN